MYLHENRNQFLQASEVVARAIDRPATYVIKDYYVTLMLKEVFANNDQLVFKGGTALSKCYGIIERFSEDIDLGIEEEKATQGQRKKIKATIVAAADTLGLRISNLDDTRSRRDFNRYELPLPEDYSGSAVTNTLYIETSVMTPVAPTAVKTVSSLMGDHLARSGHRDLIEEYSLEPFEVRVTSLERSLCDKVYAICDYYLEKRDLAKPSRHVYDIHKLLDAVNLDAGLLALMDRVRLERRASMLDCPSAEEGVDLPTVLGDIVENEAYRAGYENTTMRLLNPSESVLYDEAIDSIREIIEFLQRASGPVSRVLSRTTIYLGRTSPHASSTQPERTAGPTV